MIFALLDYLKYRFRKGRYSEDQSDGGMHLAFFDIIPEAQIRKFKPGDMIFTQRLDSFLSWAMMYVTSSPVDHTAIYVGNGNVLHMTLDGSRIHSLRSIAKGSRILVVRMGPTEHYRWQKESELLSAKIDTNSNTHNLPPKIQLAFAALKSIHGKYDDRFKWLIWSDFAILLVIISLFLYEISGYLTSFIPFLSSAFFLLFYKFKSMRRRWLKLDSIIMSHPDLAYKSFFKAGGLMFTKMNDIAVLSFGLLPLEMVLSLARQRTDDSTNDNLQKSSELLRNLIKGWNIIDAVQTTEGQNT